MSGTGKAGQGFLLPLYDNNTVGESKVLCGVSQKETRGRAQAASGCLMGALFEPQNAAVVSVCVTGECPSAVIGEVQGHS